MVTDIRFNFRQYGLWLLLGLCAIVLFATMHQGITGAVIGLSPENITLGEKAIADMEADKIELEELGFTIVYFDDSIIEAKESLQQGNLGRVIELSRELTSRKQQALDLVAALPIIKADLDSQEKMGINVSKAKELYTSVGIGIKDERYSEAQFDLNRLSVLLKQQRSEYSRVHVLIKAGKEGIIQFISKHYAIVLALFGILIILGAIFYNKIMVKVTSNRISKLDVEKNVILTLMKKAQENYFNAKNISKSTYRMKMRLFADRIEEMKEQRPLLVSELNFYRRRKLFEMPKKRGGLAQ